MLLDFNKTLQIFQVGGYEALHGYLMVVGASRSEINYIWKESIKLSPGVNSPLYWYREALIPFL
jgi:hypothetical protein